MVAAHFAAFKMRSNHKFNFDDSYVSLQMLVQFKCITQIQLKSSETDAANQFYVLRRIKKLDGEAMMETGNAFV